MGTYLHLSKHVSGKLLNFINISDFIPVPGYTTSENTELSVLTGASVPLECHGFGYPEPTVSWTKDGAEITLTNDRYS